MTYSFTWDGGTATAYNTAESKPVASEGAVVLRPIGRPPVVLTDGAITTTAPLQLLAQTAEEISDLDAMIAYCGPIEMSGPWDEGVSPTTTTIRLIGDRTKTRSGTPSNPRATYDVTYTVLES